MARRLSYVGAGCPVLATGDAMPDASRPSPSTEEKKQPTTDLVRDAMDAATKLVRIEVALAQREFDKQIAAAKKAAVPLGLAAAAAIVAVAVLLVGVALALPVPWLAAMLIGAGLLIAATVLGVAGWRILPKRPLEETRDRVGTDVEQLKERVA
jgi:uncharacterized membrane protein YqjE